MKRTVLILLAFLLPACGGGDSSSVTSGTFSGVIAGPNGESGTLEIVIPAAQAKLLPTEAVTTALVDITGPLKLTGGTIDLAGTFNPDDQSFTISGGGYTFSGTISGGAIGGTYSGPNGDGSFSIFDEGDGAVTTFCGTFSGDQSGTWNMIVQGGEAAGTYGGTVSGYFEGNVSGQTVTITYDSLGGVSSASGTISGSSMTGAWSGGGESGTWEGSTSACP